MREASVLSNPDVFSETLYERLKPINSGIEEMELYEFRYGLNPLVPETGGWASVELEKKEEIEKLVNSSAFYADIQIKPLVGDRIVLDPMIVRLTVMLFVGLVTGEYSPEWIRAHFYFDIRGFYFLHRTVYFSDAVLAHFGGKPYRSFEQRQPRFEKSQSIGYKEFKESNKEVDQFFIGSVKQLIAVKGTPMLIALAGPTAAGKTEIVERLCAILKQDGKKITSIELDNFLTDRDYREQKGIYTLGKEAIHFELFRQGLEEIRRGKKIAIPRYDFIFGTSSHDLSGGLKPGCDHLEVEPADIVFIEGNFPFLIPEIAASIGIKVVYLTDDAIRLKRKWKRDIDYRKKYDPSYLRNRFFREQFLMTQKCYLPQLAICDIAVDTTGAAIWAAPEIAAILSQV
jgi:uridine kinase